MWKDAEGVEQRGVIHRDIKPANVLLTTDGVARLTDFGLVRSEGGDEEPEVDRGRDAPRIRHSGRAVDSMASGSWQTVTVDGGLVGTPPYMAPELWRQALRGTVATDVYAFGCLMYELICGRRPFVMKADPATQTREAHLGGWMRMHLRDEPPDPGQFVAGLHPRLSALMRSCVAKDAEHRPQSFSLIRGWLADIYSEIVGSPYPRPKPVRTKLLADSLNNRGVSFVTLDLVDRAAASFDEALGADPGHLQATYNAALVEWRVHGLGESEFERRLSEGERRLGETVESSLMRARWRLLMDDPAGAEKALGSLGGAEIRNPALRRELGIAALAGARARGDRQEIEEVRTLLRSAIEESPSDVPAAVALAVACELSGDEKSTGEALDRARRYDDSLPESLAEAAAVHVPGCSIMQSIQVSDPVQCLVPLGRGEVGVRTADSAVVVLRRGDHRPERRVALGGPARPGRSLALAMGGRVLVACLENGPLTLFDTETGERLRNLRPHPGVATCVAVSWDGRRAATGGSDRCLRLWDLEGGECLQSLQGHDAFITSLSWLPGTTSVVTGSADGTLRLWDLEHGRSERVMDGRRGPVRAVASTANGAIAVAGSQDGSIAMWDLEAGELRRRLQGPGGPVTAVALVDGAVVAGSEDGTVRLWDAEAGSSGRVVRFPGPVQDLVPAGGSHLWVAHGSAVSSVFAPRQNPAPLPLVLAETATSVDLAEREEDFRNHLAMARALMASGQINEAIDEVRMARGIQGYDLHSDALELWNRVLAFYPKRSSRSVVEVRRLSCGEGTLTACGYTADGAILSGDSDGNLWRFDVASSGQEPPFADQGCAVTAIAAAENGPLVASAGRDGKIRLWDAVEGRLGRVLEGNDGAVNGIALSPDGKIISAGEDGSLRLWVAEDGGLATLLGSSQEALLAVAASADGRFAVSAGWDNFITVWSLRQGSELHRLVGHEGPVLTVAVSPDCRTIASGGADGSVRLWDLESGRCRRTLDGHSGAVQSVAVTPDARFVVSAGKDSTLRVWDARTGAAVNVVEGHSGEVVDLAIDSSGGAAASVGADSSLRSWFLDWEPEEPEDDRWDDRVRPFLEVFLRRREQGHNSNTIPTWDASDIDALLIDLGRRGFGWLARERVERELELMARNRDEVRAEEQSKTQQLAKQRQREQQAAPAKEVLDRLTRNLGLKIAAAAVVLILVVLGISAVRTPRSAQAEFSDRSRADMTRLVAERGRRMRRGAALAYQEKPTVTDETCIPERLPLFLDIALNAESQHEPPLDPGLPCEDQGFRKVYADSIRCAGELGDQDLVRSVLDAAGSYRHPFRLEDFAVILVGIGEPAEPALGSALTDYSETLRHLAALSLVHGDSQSAQAVLLEALGSGQIRGVEGASYVLTELIVLGAIDESVAFDTCRRLCRSIDPRVRRNAVRSLVLFERTGPVADLLEEVLLDVDPEVVLEAERTREVMRSAKIQQIFGAD